MTTACSSEYKFSPHQSLTSQLIVVKAARRTDRSSPDPLPGARQHVIANPVFELLLAEGVQVYDFSTGRRLVLGTTFTFVHFAARRSSLGVRVKCAGPDDTGQRIVFTAQIRLVLRDKLRKFSRLSSPLAGVSDCDPAWSAPGMANRDVERIHLRRDRCMVSDFGEAVFASSRSTASNCRP